TTHASSSSMVLSFGILGRSTTTTVTCDSPVIVVTPSLCHVITVDMSPGTPITPTGDFALATSSSGTFDHNCILAGTGATATCMVNYTPTVTGYHMISATYPQNNNPTNNTTLTHNPQLPRKHTPTHFHLNHKRNNSPSPHHHPPHMPTRISRHWNSHIVHCNSNRFFRNRHSHHPNRNSWLHNQCNRDIRNPTLHTSRRNNRWDC